ncbi:MAG: PspA/IM30 family protein [Pseudomonadota bacterium]|nr:PspA/IM30 family protein [Pseudomonadota bacterium]
MGFFSKLLTAFRGLAHEAGDNVLDTQALRILEQELRDAKAHLESAKESLAKVMAEQMGVEREVKRLQKARAEYEDYAIRALDKGEQQLAEEIAEKIATLENELTAQQHVLESYDHNIKELKHHIRNAERNTQALEREINVVKTTESVHKANVAAHVQFSGSNSALHSATESLQRIKEKQQQRADQLAAARQLHQHESGSELQDKLRQAGIIADTEAASSASVLARLKAKQDEKKPIQI